MAREPQLLHQRSYRLQATLRSRPRAKHKVQHGADFQRGLHFSEALITRQLQQAGLIQTPCCRVGLEEMAVSAAAPLLGEPAAQGATPVAWTSSHIVLQATAHGRG